MPKILRKGYKNVGEKHVAEKCPKTVLARVGHVVEIWTEDFRDFYQFFIVALLWMAQVFMLFILSSHGELDSFIIDVDTSSTGLI